MLSFSPSVITLMILIKLYITFVPLSLSVRSQNENIYEFIVLLLKTSAKEISHSPETLKL